MYIIAEIGVNHNGNMSLAKKMILAAKKNGANAVKFQSFKAETLVTKITPKIKYQRLSTSKKVSHYDLIKSLELSYKNHFILKKFCKTKKIDFISTPYDLESLKFLDRIGVKVFKVASADMVDISLHEYLAKLKKKVIISTGMCELSEISRVLSIYKKNKFNMRNLIMLHCTSNYPASDKSLNLKAINLLKKKFKIEIGYSDHSTDFQASVIAAAYGAKTFERHFTTSKKLPGPDQKASSDPKEFKEYVERIKRAVLQVGVEKKYCQAEEKEMRGISRKSIVAKEIILKNQVITINDISYKRPGFGIYPIDRHKIVGKKSKIKIMKDKIILAKYLKNK